jgi:hypothetical protein
MGAQRIEVRNQARASALLIEGMEIMTTVHFAVATLRGRGCIGVRRPYRQPPVLSPVRSPPSPDASDLLWTAIIAAGKGDRARLASARAELMRLGRESGENFTQFADEAVDPVADHLARTLSCPREEALRAVRRDFVDHVIGPLRLQRLGLWPT